MKTSAYLLLAPVLVLLFCLPSDVNSQVVRKPANRVENVKAAIAKLREFYFRRDYEGGYEVGQKLVNQFPENTELNAWFVVNMARNEMSKEAVEAAKKLVENDKENAWARFALANAYIRNAQTKEAISATETALKMMPDDEEFIFLYASSLLMQKKYDEIFSWLDKNSSKIKNQSRLLQTKANAQYRQSTAGKFDEAKRKLSFETFIKSIEVFPNSVDSNYLYGSYLNYDKRFAEAYPFLKKAASLSPNVVHIRQALWKAILQGQPDKSEQQRKDEAVADSNNLLRLRPNSINALENVSAFYGQELEMPDKKKVIDAVILKKYPQSAQSERILIGEIRRFSTRGKDGKDDEIKKRQLVQKIRNFINRPKHFDDSYLGESYSNLFYYLKDDKNTSDAELLRIAEQTTKYLQWGISGTYSTMTRGLAERKMFRQAEDILNLGFKKVKEDMEKQRASFKDEKEFEVNLNSMNATLYGARGWNLFKENRFDEAERELRQAIKLNNEISATYNTLGQVHEAKNEFEKAEDAFINAFSNFYGKENPNLDKLKSLYEKRNGNLNGIEAYFEKVKAIERDLRRERVLSAKIIDAASAKPFTLKNLEAKQISFADLKGKVIVVNIWGTWCAPCVGEMPDFQELHRKYQNDKDVVLLTINNDEDLETVKKFMTAKKYDFAVLRDEKYLETVNINAFPTTWFIDRAGKVSFVKVGANDKLFEEFGWRIEELKKQR